MNIATAFDPKPIPDRSYDWDAWDQDNPEKGTEHAPTEAEAIAALVERDSE